MEHREIRWGIIGLGAIAHEFAMGLKNSPSSKLYAVASRSLETAQEFAMNYEAEKFYGNYAELANDPEVDVIYIATPHIYHKENTLLSLEGGKHVLCEKPFAMNAEDAAIMVASAKEKGLFLMEAMWSRFFPLVIKLREIITEQRIGAITSIQSEFGFKAQFDPDDRLFNKDLGGGALLDIGIYLVSYVHMLMGEPERIEAGADIGVTDVDERCTIQLHYPGNAVARLFCSITEERENEFKIIGTQGSIIISRPFWCPDRMVVEVKGKGLKEYKFEREGNGYNYEAEAVSQAILNGEKEVSAMPLSESVAILKIVDEIRKQSLF